MGRRAAASYAAGDRSTVRMPSRSESEGDPVVRIPGRSESEGDPVAGSPADLSPRATRSSGFPVGLGGTRRVGPNMAAFDGRHLVNCPSDGLSGTVGLFPSFQLGIYPIDFSDPSIGSLPRSIGAQSRSAHHRSAGRWCAPGPTRTLALWVRGVEVDSSDRRNGMVFWRRVDRRGCAEGGRDSSAVSVVVAE
jgi:hypothetical protein